MHLHPRMPDRRTTDWICDPSGGGSFRVSWPLMISTSTVEHSSNRPMCPSSIFESHDFAEITVSRYPRNELYGPVDGQGYCPMVGGIDQSPRRFVMVRYAHNRAQLGDRGETFSSHLFQGRHYSVCMPKIPIEMPCPLPPQTLAKAVHDGSEPQCVIPCDVVGLLNMRWLRIEEISCGHGCHPSFSGLLLD